MILIRQSTVADKMPELPKMERARSVNNSLCQIY